MSESTSSTLAPPVGAGNSLVLSPPTPVQVVSDDEVTGAIPLDPARQTELRAKARAFATELAAMDVNSPAFTEKVNSIAAMGDREMRSAASMSSRMLDRPAAALGRAKNRPGADVQNQVSDTLIDLRATITDLDPSRADLQGARRLLKFLPGGRKAERYFAKYQSAQAHLNAIIRSLEAGQDDLRKDNASIEAEKANLWSTLGKLTEYSQLAAALDDEVTERIAELRLVGNTKQADTLHADALFPIRQRRQDIMTQMTVAVQGYLALDLIRRNNLELIRGVDRAQVTTIAALRTAVIVSQALSRQRLVLEQITALNETTSGLIEATSVQLRIQAGEINQQAASSTVDVARLQAAFDNVFATMDALDTFRLQATDAMEETVIALEGQLERAQPYLERTRRAEGRNPA